MTPQQDSDGWPNSVVVLAIGGIILLIASIITLAYAVTYANINACTDWSGLTTNLTTVSVWLCVVVIGFSWEPVLAKFKRH